MTLSVVYDVTEYKEFLEDQTGIHLTPLWLFNSPLIRFGRTYLIKFL